MSNTNGETAYDSRTTIQATSVLQKNYSHAWICNYQCSSCYECTITHVSVRDVTQKPLSRLSADLQHGVLSNTHFSKLFRKRNMTLNS